jgi:hypothetical protein
MVARRDPNTAAERQAKRLARAKADSKRTAERQTRALQDRVAADRTREFGAKRPKETCDYGAWAAWLSARYRFHCKGGARPPQKAIDWLRYWVYRYGLEIEQRGKLSELRRYVQLRDGAHRGKGGDNVFAWVIHLVGDRADLKPDTRSQLSKSLANAKASDLPLELLVPLLRAFPEGERPGDEFYGRRFDEAISAIQAGGSSDTAETVRQDVDHE